jgi:hypothetical protein
LIVNSKDDQFYQNCEYFEHKANMRNEKNKIHLDESENTKSNNSKLLTNICNNYLKTETEDNENKTHNKDSKNEPDIDQSNNILDNTEINHQYETTRYINDKTKKFLSFYKSLTFCQQMILYQISNLADGRTSFIKLYRLCLYLSYLDHSKQINAYFKGITSMKWNI